MKTISHLTLATILASVNAASICALTTTTTAKMNKRGNPLANEDVRKVCVRKNYQFGYNYANGVNNRLEKQGCEANFEAESLAWGEWVIPNKIITHKSELYGRFYRMENSIEETSYLVNGRVATASEVETIKAFTPKQSDSNRQAEAGLTEHQVKPMAIKFASIDRISIGGETYQVSHETSEAEVA